MAINKTAYVVILVFLSIFLVYVTSPVITSFDSRWSVHTSLSLIKQGNTDLNEYEDIIKANDYYAIETIDGKLYTIFPVGTSALAAPFVAIADFIYEPLVAAVPAIESFLKAQLANIGKPVETLTLLHLYQPVELIIASFFCALAGVFVFLTARSKLSLRSALLVVFIFAFCTSSWSVSSRALWQHGPSMLMLAIAIYLICKEHSIKGIVKYSAVPLAIAFIVRPTNAIPILFISAYIWVNHRQQILGYFLLALPFALALFAYNLAIYDALLPPYFAPDRVMQPDGLLLGLAGNLISPSRGLLVYSPIVLLGFVWLIRHFSTLNFKSLPLYLLATIVVHWLVISSFPHWWAGHSYGPRFFADMIPIFMYFIILFLADLDKASITNQRKIFAAVMPLLLFSFFVNAKGAWVPAVYHWNVKPNNIDTNTERLWDWRDPPFSR